MRKDKFNLPYASFKDRLQSQEVVQENTEGNVVIDYMTG